MANKASSRRQSDIIINYLEQESQETETVQDEPSRWPTVVIWEHFLFATIVYNYITVTYFFGQPGFPSGAWLYIEYLTETIAVVDLFIRYCLIREKHVLLHTKFDDTRLGRILLFLSSLPTSIVLNGVLAQNSKAALWVAIVRWHKLYRMKQLPLYFDTLEIRGYRQLPRLCQSLLYIFFFTHTLACLWLWTPRVDPIVPLSWLTLSQYNLYEVPNLQKYIDSFLFTTASMNGLGSPNILPHTDLEHFIQVFIIFVGVGMCAQYFGYFAIRVMAREEQRAERRRLLKDTLAILEQQNDNLALIDKVTQFFNVHSGAFDKMQDCLSFIREMPRTLQLELMLHFTDRLIPQVNFFGLDHGDLLSRFLLAFNLEMALAGSTIVRKGGIADSFFIIIDGRVQIMAGNGLYLESGQYFGEVGILVTGKRSCSVVAVTTTNFLTVEKQEFLEILNGSSITLRYLQSVANQRLQRTPIDSSALEDEFALINYSVSISGEPSRPSVIVPNSKQAILSQSIKLQCRVVLHLSSHNPLQSILRAIRDRLLV